MSIRSTLLGVDFSGAANAGDLIWIAEAVSQFDRVYVTACYPASALPNSGSRRSTALPALRERLIRPDVCAAGLDFPFSLHHSQARGSDWRTFAARFADEYPEPEALYAHAGGKGRELRRRTDSTAHAPFPPANLRLYRQTYYGIREVLAPLAVSGAAAVVPMQPHDAHKPALLEICPAVTLRRLGLRFPRYKGKERESRLLRERILQGLNERGLSLHNTCVRLVIDEQGGNALDSVIAAFGTAFALTSGQLEREFDAIERLEGVIFG